MSIRAKITLLVLIVGLSEAILLGVIGYNSVATVSANAAELRRIGSAIEGARSLSVSLSRLSDPVDLLLGAKGDARVRFDASLGDLERRVATCAATACHGYEKRPPEMAGQLLHDLQAIRSSGVRILGSRLPGAPPLAEWAEAVDRPARQVFQMTNEMSDTLMAKARAIEASSRGTERSALILVAVTALSCVLVAVALCHPLARGIARPLEDLAERSLRIAEGDLQTGAEETGPREVVLLARAFNSMRLDLARHREEQRRHQEGLERAVAERVGELRRKDDQLRRAERLAGIGLVAGAVAHDLNNPLTNILLNAETLLDSTPAGDPRHGPAEDVVRDARRCQKIAHDIRALGREGEIERVPCDLRTLAEEAAHLLRHKCELRRVAVRCEAPPGDVSCHCSPPRILQLLLNLVENAVDASPERGTVVVSLRPAERGPTIEISDRGPGLTAEQREKLFRPFYTTKPDGTGLGLPLSRRIAEQHGGTIEIESRREGEGTGAAGTTVRVSLPGPGRKPRPT